MAVKPLLKKAHLIQYSRIAKYEDYISKSPIPFPIFKGIKVARGDKK
jgi:hypothetical protein